jgi:hypothetical protein
MSDPKRQFAVCVDNTDCEASLIVLYHRSQFILVEFPAEVERALSTV